MMDFDLLQGAGPSEAPIDKRRPILRLPQGRDRAGASSDDLLTGAEPVKANAPQSGFVMGWRDPIDAGAQLLERLVPDSVATGVNKANNWLADRGFPVTKVPETATGASDLVQAVNREYDAQRRANAQTLSGLVTGQQPEPGFDWARLAGNVVNPVNLVAAPEVAAARTIGSLALRGGAAGAVSGALQPVTQGDPQEFWETKAKQALAGAAGGAVAGPVTSKVGTTVAKAVQRAAGSKPAVNVEVALSNAFGSQGMDLREVPEVIRESVRRQISEAVAGGQRMDPAAMIRKAQFEAVGLTGEAGPTAGQLTRDPMQFANEKNLSGVRIRTPQGEGNPLADRFGNQNKGLIDVFDSAGAAGAADRVTAGQVIGDALRAADGPAKAAVDDAYASARAMANGRAAELERGTFSQNANAALDQGMWGAFLPAEVRTLLNQITAGKTPFDVDAAVQIDTLLSRAARKAERGGDDAGAAAVNVVRKALHETPLASAEAGAVPAITAAAQDTGALARQAFDEARAAARQRFATIDATPALKAALDDTAPDRFVQNFILNANVRDIDAMKKVLENSPEALAQARAQLADHLKRAAFGENQSGDAAFAAGRYANTLRAIGRKKLEAFFNPAEVDRLIIVGRVASDINSVPAGARYAVNSSGTGAALFNLLSKISEAPGLRQIPGARMLANQVGEIKTERAMNAALRPPPGKKPTELSPEAMRAIQRLFPLGSTAGGVLGGQSVQ